MLAYFKPFEKKPKRILSGFPVSHGKSIGFVRILSSDHTVDLDKEINKVKKGDIIVAEMTRPQFILAIRRASGIITDMGGNLCHAAIVAREFDIPAVVGTQIATSTLEEGQRVILDGNEGYIYED
jgi:pyruvate,water dikinase